MRAALGGAVRTALTSAFGALTSAFGALTSALGAILLLTEEGSGDQVPQAALLLSFTLLDTRRGLLAVLELARSAKGGRLVRGSGFDEGQGADHGV